MRDGEEIFPEGRARGWERLVRKGYDRGFFNSCLQSTRLPEIGPIDVREPKASSNRISGDAKLGRRRREDDVDQWNRIGCKMAKWLVVRVGSSGLSESGGGGSFV